LCSSEQWWGFPVASRLNGDYPGTTQGGQPIGFGLLKQVTERFVGGDHGVVIR
jgi:hypothetical protein